MSLFSILMFFTVLWWLIFLITLPFGIRRAENPEQGHDAGAPEKPRLLIKALVTTVTTSALTGALAVAVEYGLIDMRQLLGVT